MYRLFYRLNRKKLFAVLLALLSLLLLLNYISEKCNDKFIFNDYLVEQNDNNDNAVGKNNIRISGFTKCDGVYRNNESVVVHVSAIIGGYNTARMFTVLMKSLLFYRRNFIQLHLVVDSAAYASLKTLFETWKLPQLSVVFYNASEFKNEVSWIENKHYSGIFGLYKMILPSILPKQLDKVIVLDADLVVTGNILDLWRYFDSFNTKQVIGLVENQSDWYLNSLNKSSPPWPAVGRGFNTGVMLMHLQRLRRLRWQAFLLEAVRQLRSKYGAVQLADQDPINFYIVQHQDHLFRLPCLWNVQQGIHSLSSLCRPVFQRRFDYRRVRIIHWNSPSKAAVAMNSGTDIFIQNKLRRYFAGLRQTFIEYDGNLLRRDLIGAFSDSINDCDKQSSNSITNQLSEVISDESVLDNLKDGYGGVDEEDECSEIRVEQKFVRRTHLNFLEFNYTTDGPDDVTLISQMSLDRLQILEDIARHWPGPMSLCVYLSDSEANQLVEFVVHSPFLSGRQNIAFHVVYKEGQFYPVNTLRNIALQNAITNFVFIIDFDFLPNHELYSYSREMIRNYVLDQKNNGASFEAKVALIVPAFETFQYRLNFPRSKAELLTMLNTGEISPFRQDVWRAGHGATDYAQWKAATRPYEVQWKADYEPYVIVSRKNNALFDTRFVGFGWNKVAFIMGLDILSYRFLVLPNAFIIHLPHAPSLDVARFRTTPLYRECLNKFKIEYIKSLAKKFGVRALKYLQFRKDQPS